MRQLGNFEVENVAEGSVHRDPVEEAVLIPSPSLAEN